MSRPCQYCGDWIYFGQRNGKTTPLDPGGRRHECTGVGCSHGMPAMQAAFGCPPIARAQGLFGCQELSQPSALSIFKGLAVVFLLMWVAIEAIKWFMIP